jgi:hypothetical protein
VQPSVSISVVIFFLPLRARRIGLKDDERTLMLALLGSGAARVWVLLSSLLSLLLSFSRANDNKPIFTIVTPPRSIQSLILPGHSRPASWFSDVCGTWSLGLDRATLAFPGI